ncbi:MAG: BatA domain-containing protein [Phycisphaerae bacterium]
MVLASFLFPWILAGLAAAAAPVLIHLIMRTKPRKVTFPALRFVRKTHQANISKLRLKHILLLAMRIGIIVLIVLLLARWRTTSVQAVEDRSVPAGAVVILDNSGSMSYRHRGQSLLEQGRRIGRQIVEKLPRGSNVAVLNSSQPSSDTGFITDRKLLAQQIAEMSQGYGAQPLNAAVVRALAMLRTLEMGRKEIYIVTDRTVRSWEETGGFRSARGVAFVVFDVSQGGRANIAMQPLQLSARSVPVRSEVWAEVSVSGNELGGQLPVSAELGGKPVTEQVLRLPPGSTAGTRISVRPEREGILHGRVTIGQDDPLVMDNTRFFTLHATAPRNLLIVHEANTNPTRRAIAAAAAPDAAVGMRNSGYSVRYVPAGGLSVEQLKNADAAILADVGSLTESQWRILGDFVRGGRLLWVLIGPDTSSAVAAVNSGPAREVLPVTLGPMVQLEKLQSLDASQLSHPLLQPFLDPENPPLSEMRVRRRMAVESLAADAKVVARFEDRTPAIVTGPLGKGQVLLWNLSPLRPWTNMTRTYAFPILAQRAIRYLLSEDAPERQVIWGQAVTLEFPEKMKSVRVELLRPGQDQPSPLVPELGRRTVTLRADRLGGWTVRFSENDRTVEKGFSVNAASEESDLRPIEPDDLMRMFPPESVTLADSLEDVNLRRRVASEPLEIAPLLLLLLLGLMIGESFFANRFYKTVDPEEVEQARQGRSGRE